MKYEIAWGVPGHYPEDRVRIIAESEIDGEAYISAYDFRLDKPIGEAFKFVEEVSVLAMERAKARLEESRG